MDAARVNQLSEGELPDDLTAGERAIVALARKTVIAPALLEPADTEALIAAYGERAGLELATFAAAFHGPNKLADLVGIEREQPLVQRRIGWVRRLGVRLQGWAIGKVLDLSNQEARVDIGVALADYRAVGFNLPPRLEHAARLGPNIAGLLGAIGAAFATIDPQLIDRVGRAVAGSLARDEDEARGLHRRPDDPLDALVFVGTRYAARTTDALVDAVRRAEGMDDATLTDVFFSIAILNGLERLVRLMGGDQARAYVA